MKKRNTALILIASLIGVLVFSVAVSYARNGADDPVGDDHGGLTQTTDDPAGDDHGGLTQAGDDPAGHDSAARSRVRRSGSCSGRSDWKLKAKHDDGRIETEFEVDPNRSGVRWRVRMRHDGTLFVNTTRRTHAPSGSFSLERRVRNHSGLDRITATAKRRNGEICRASLKI